MSKLVVPLLEVPEHADNIRIMDLDLPGINVDDINVDVKRLQRAMHWGGIKYLALGSYEGEGTEYTVSGLSVNQDGSVIANKAKIAKRARIANPESQGLHEDDEYRWRNTAVYFNTTALEEKDASPKEIVKSLDISLRTNIAAEIGEKEVGPHRILGELAAAVATVGLAKIVGLDSFEDIEWSDAPMITITPKIVLPGVQKMYKLIDKRDEELSPKYSTMFYWRVDRALLAARHLSRKIITLNEEK